MNIDICNRVYNTLDEIKFKSELEYAEFYLKRNSRFHHFCDDIFSLNIGGKRKRKKTDVENKVNIIFNSRFDCVKKKEKEEEEIVIEIKKELEKIENELLNNKRR